MSTFHPLVKSPVYYVPFWQQHSIKIKPLISYQLILLNVLPMHVETVYLRKGKNGIKTLKFLFFSIYHVSNLPMTMANT